jgi:hypothetical protein
MQAFSCRLNCRKCKSPLWHTPLSSLTPPHLNVCASLSLICASVQSCTADWCVISECQIEQNPNGIVLDHCSIRRAVARCGGWWIRPNQMLTELRLFAYDTQKLNSDSRSTKASKPTLETWSIFEGWHRFWAGIGCRYTEALAWVWDEPNLCTLCSSDQ